MKYPAVLTPEQVMLVLGINEKLKASELNTGRLRGVIDVLQAHTIDLVRVHAQAILNQQRPGMTLEEFAANDPNSYVDFMAVNSVIEPVTASGSATEATDLEYLQLQEVVGKLQNLVNMLESAASTASGIIFSLLLP